MAAGKSLDVEAPVVAVERKRKKAAAAAEGEDEDAARKRAKKAAKKAAALEAAAGQNEDSAEAAAPKKPKAAKDEPAEAAEGFTGNLSADEYREKNGISAPGGEELPAPVQRFEDAPFGKKVIAGLLAAGFAAPSPIQAQAWPVAITGQDLVAIAKTGSGKTLGFLLPAFRSLGKATEGEAPGAAEVGALILAPTRELVAQIEAECKKFEVYSKTTSAAVFGGVPKSDQVKACKRKPQVLVATPGRLQDLMEMGVVSLRKVSFMVLDEADRMLDMGFEPEIANILGHTPKERQTLLFSATWPKSVQRIASGYLKEDHLHINVGHTEELSANKAVTQEFFKLNDDEKEMQLWRIIADLGEENKMICFTNTKRRVVALQKAFFARGFESAALHGDKPQRERDADLKLFASGQKWLLFGTDVCARGLDIKDVTHVVNYDMARDVEGYVHRIGRTGRAGRSGKSITFWNEDYDMECAPALVKIAKEADNEVPKWLEDAAGKQSQVKNKMWRYEGAKTEGAKTEGAKTS